MKKGIAFLLISLLLLSIATGLIVSNSAMADYEAPPKNSAALASSDASSNDWPMFHCNAAHTNSPDNIAPETYDLLWCSNSIWGRDVIPSVLTTSPVVVGGVVYVGADGGGVRAYNTTSGTIIWNALSGSSVSSPAVVGGVAYVGVGNGFNYALNASTGAVIWNASRGSSDSSPAVANDVFYDCSDDGQSVVSLIARNASTGVLLWNSTISGNSEGSPVVVENRVYVSADGYLYAFNATTGALQWRRYVCMGNTYDTPTVAEGKVYIKCEGATSDGDVLGAFDVNTGASVWNSTIHSSDGSTPCIADGILYVGSNPDGVFALNASTGAQIWNFPKSTWYASPALAGGIVYICSHDGNIYGLNATTGAQLWSRFLGPGGVSCSPAIGGGILCIIDVNGCLCAFGKANQASISLSPKVNLAGSTVSISGAGFTSNSIVTATFGGQPVTLTSSAVDSLGHFSGNFQINPSTAPGTYQISVTDTGAVTAYANFTVVGSPSTSWPMFMHDLQHTGSPDNFVPTSNNTLWTYKIDNGEISNQVASSAAVVEGIVYTASLNCYVYAFDAYTGECYWKYSLPGLGMLSSPSVVDGVVYIGSDYGLFALNAYTGEKIWQAADSVLINSSPAVSGGLVFTGSFVAQGIEEHGAYAFRASDGQLVWKFTTSDYVDSSPVVVDSTVFVGCDDGYLYALNAVNGEIVWKFNTTGTHPYDSLSASPAVADGVVYTSTYHGNVFAVDIVSGSKIWNHTIGTLGGGFVSPIISNGVLYIAAKDSIYALNAANGDEMWRCEVTSAATPAIVGGVVYASSADGRIWAIDALTGAKTLHYVTEGGIRVQVAIARGVIYVGTTHGTMYAIGTPDLITPQPTPAPTPTNYPIPTPTTNPTTVPTQAPANTPTPHPTATPTPQPSQAPNPSNVIKATTEQGTQVELSITGNITSTQISNATIATNQTTSKTTIAFTLTGQSGTTGYANITIPKSAISNGGVPTIYIDGTAAQNQGFTMDNANFYVWFETHFSTHQIEIIIDAVTPTSTPSSAPQHALFQSLGFVEIAIVTLLCVLVATVIIAIVRSKRKSKKPH